MSRELSQELTQLIQGFIFACACRWDCYALLRQGGDYTRVYGPLTTHLLSEHLSGAQVLGVYMVTQKGKCRFAVFRPTSPAGVSELVDLHHRLAEYSIPSYLEVVPRGMRLWLFLGFWCELPLLWQALLPLCPANVKLYPRQDSPSYEHSGSMVRLPLGTYSDGARYPFVESLGEDRFNPYFATVKEGLHWFQTVERVSRDSLTHLVGASSEQGPSILQSFNPSQVLQSKEKEKKEVLQKSLDFPPASSNTASIPVTSINPSNPSSILQRSEVVPHGRQSSLILEWCSRQDPIKVIGHYVKLNVNGQGCCPFGFSHGQTGHGENDRSLKVYWPASTSPKRYCWWCHVVRRGGNVFEFLMLYHNVGARQLLGRILHGEQF